MFCSASVTQAYCVGGRKLSSRALSTRMFHFFHLFFISQKKGREKGKRALEKQGNRGRLTKCFL